MTTVIYYAQPVQLNFDSSYNFHECSRHDRHTSVYQMYDYIRVYRRGTGQSLGTSERSKAQSLCATPLFYMPAVRRVHLNNLLHTLIWYAPGEIILASILPVQKSLYAWTRGSCDVFAVTVQHLVSYADAEQNPRPHNYVNDGTVARPFDDGICLGKVSNCSVILTLMFTTE